MRRERENHARNVERSRRGRFGSPGGGGSWRGQKKKNGEKGKEPEGKKSRKKNRKTLGKKTPKEGSKPTSLCFLGEEGGLNQTHFGFKEKGFNQPWTL